MSKKVFAVVKNADGTIDLVLYVDPDTLCPDAWRQIQQAVLSLMRESRKPN